MNTRKSEARARQLLDTARSQIDGCLEDWLRRAHRDFASYNSEQIVAEVGRSAIGRGARLRPLLCCCGYAVAGGEGGLLDSRIVRVAASLELLHTFAILHDDVMDGSEMRRGERSLFRRIAGERSDLGAAEAARLGLSVAILAGDLSLVLSDQLFAESGFSAQRLVQATEPLARMRRDAVAGQYLDLTHSGPLAGPPDEELAITIARLKTGSYTVEGPLLVGAYLGLAGPPTLQALSAFARPLGEAFQLTDDLLGLFGDPAQTGKDAENDLRRGKPTPLITSAFQMAAEPQRAEILAVWGNPEASADDIEGLRRIVRATGALQAMQTRIREAVAAASAALDEPESKDLDQGTVDLLLVLARGVEARAAETP